MLASPPSPLAPIERIIMRPLKITDVSVGVGESAVMLRVPVDGRPRTVRFDPGDAVQIANQLATAAVEITPARPRASMTAVDMRLGPYRADGAASLAILTVEHGPFVVDLDDTLLRALAAAANAALEFAKPAGQA